MSGRATPTIEANWNEYKRARLRFFRFRHQADFAQNLALALGLAAITGLAAQVQIVLPFTPVPITLTTFAVLLTGVVLGARWGGASQALYVGIGAAGVPWFAGAGGGLGVIFGATGGYIIGFILAATFVGFFTDRYVRARRVHRLFGVLLVANFIVIYSVGLPWLFGWLTLIQGTTPSLLDLLTMGLFPFIPGDIVKLLVVLAIAKVIIPIESYGPERHG